MTARSERDDPAAQKVSERPKKEKAAPTWTLRDIPDAALARVDQFKREIGKNPSAATTYKEFARGRKTWNVQRMSTLKDSQGRTEVLDTHGNEVTALSDLVERGRVQLVENTQLILQADASVPAADLLIENTQTQETHRDPPVRKDQAPGFDYLVSTIVNSMKRTPLFTPDTTGWGHFTLGKYPVGRFNQDQSIDIIGKQVIAQNIVFQLIEAPQYRGRMLLNLKRAQRRAR